MTSSAAPSGDTPSGDASAADFDIVVLGAGSAGYATALRAAQLGLTVALIEQDKVGGTCLHRGCIPTKAWLHAAEIADGARHGAEFGIHATVDRIDLDGVKSYAAGVVDRLHKGLTGTIDQRGITSISGTGRLVIDGRADANPVRGVEVDGKLITGRTVVLATGSYPRTLNLEVDGERVLTSEHALTMSSLPSSAIVLGGGVIGVEFASAWSSFGVEVTIVEALDRLVPAEDPEVSKTLTRAFGKRKIKALTGTPMKSVQTRADGVTLTLESGKELTADVLLVAVGRGPATAGCALDEAGVALDRGFVAVDDRLQTSVPGVYAVGDIVAGLQLAHRGFAHGIFVAEEIAKSLGHREDSPIPVQDRDIPKVTYTDPEVASVGWSETAAREEFGEAEVESYNYNLGGNARSQILKTAGFIKVVRRTGGEVIGIHMIGARVGELIGEAQLITNWEAWPDEVAGLIHAHPTQNEALGEAHLALAGKPFHAHN